MTDRITVLVVEDEPLILLDIVDFLTDQGFRVLEATNAAEALQELENDASIRIIFTDVDMPGSIDGLKLAAAVRDRWPPIQIIVTSGHRKVSGDELPKGSPFFSKPYSLPQIADTIRAMGSRTNGA